MPVAAIVVTVYVPVVDIPTNVTLSLAFKLSMYSHVNR
jgi:hypothetical protein